MPYHLRSSRTAAPHELAHKSTGQFLTTKSPKFVDRHSLSNNIANASAICPRVLLSNSRFAGLSNHSENNAAASCAVFVFFNGARILFSAHCVISQYAASSCSL
jgi:hypothetical protein